MKDVAGQELAVGDHVAIAITGYRTMTVGRIVRFTPKGMKVVFKKPWGNYREEETFRDPHMVAKVPPLTEE